MMFAWGGDVVKENSTGSVVFSFSAREDGRENAKRLNHFSTVQQELFLPQARQHRQPPDRGQVRSAILVTPRI